MKMFLHSFDYVRKLCLKFKSAKTLIIENKLVWDLWKIAEGSLNEWY
jgi:hypothetical protein